MFKIVFNAMISTKTSKCSPENVNKPKFEKVISLNKKTEQAHISNHANSDDLKPNFFFYFIYNKETNTKTNVDIEAGKESPCSPINAPRNSSVCVVLAVGNPQHSPRRLRPQASVDAGSNASKR